VLRLLLCRSNFTSLSSSEIVEGMAERLLSLRIRVLRQERAPIYGVTSSSLFEKALRYSNLVRQLMKSGIFLSLLLPISIFFREDRADIDSGSTSKLISWMLRMVSFDSLHISSGKTPSLRG
jgi:hypothetical protein